MHIFFRIRCYVVSSLTIELQPDGLVVVGTWNAAEGANFTRLHTGGHSLIQESLFNKTLIVSTILVRLSKVGFIKMYSLLSPCFAE